MRLVKKVKFNTIKEINQFKKLDNSFKKCKEKEDKNLLSNVKDISRLNFYFVIEYINIIHEKINYDKIFPENKEGRHSKIDYNILMEEQDKLKKYINDKHTKCPEYFKKLGILNEVVGCFVIGTTKKNISSIAKLDIIKKENCISYKFDLKNLPREFEQMCIDFATNKQDFIEKEHEEFEKFMKLSNEEQDNIIQDILYKIQNPPIIFLENPTEESLIEDGGFQDFLDNSSQTATTTIEMAAEKSIENINDISFLNVMLKTALNKENYELCAKIRDRIALLKLF